MEHNFKLLVLAYIFPPSGGAGVQRVAKFCKYLPQNNVDLTVLTAKNPSVPLLDYSQTKDIPEKVKVIKVSTLEPSYSFKQQVSNNSNGKKETSSLKKKVLALGKKLLFPDPQVMWLPLMLPKLFIHLMQNPQDGIFITAPPFSSFLVVPFIRLFFRGKIVIDYRDEWETVISQYEQSVGDSPIRRFCERRILKACSSVVVTTPVFKQGLLKNYPFMNSEKISVITNGFDPDDYKGLTEEVFEDKFTIKFAGTLFRLVSPKPFLEALKLLVLKHPEISDKLKVVFIGRSVGNIFAEAIESAKKYVSIEMKGYMPHADVVEELNQSHLNLILLSDCKEQKRIYPAKVFELMAVDRIVLAVIPKGVLYDLLIEEKMGGVFCPEEIESISDYVFEQFKLWEDNKFVKKKACSKDKYTRGVLAKRLAEVFKQ